MGDDGVGCYDDRLGGPFEWLRRPCLVVTAVKVHDSPHTMVEQCSAEQGQYVAPSPPHQSRFEIVADRGEWENWFRVVGENMWKLFEEA